MKQKEAEKLTLKEYKHQIKMLVDKFPWDESNLTDNEKASLIVERLRILNAKLVRTYHVYD